MVGAGTARRVVVFSGHRIDAADRASPRFPAALADRVGDAVADALAAIGLCAGDLALTQGAAGGDVLFAEQALDLGARLRLLPPLAEPEFVAASILPVVGGSAWHGRYRQVRARIGDAACSTAPQALGSLAAGEDPFVRGNRWLLDVAFAAATTDEAPTALCLWDGRTGDGPGGTAEFVAEARRRGAHLVRIDPASL